MADASRSTMDKNNKYDRQLRLWGDHGQSALEAAKVCLINATATGTEILKNLVLPGIGSFTVVDGKKVQAEDVGNNFFLSADSVGKSRAQVATELLGELNEDVSGNFVDESAETLLENNPDFFGAFSLVIATNLNEKILLQLGEVLWERNIPLLVCRCYGFIGYLRLVVREHTIVESHPDNAHEDLRLDRPFPTLQRFCDSFDLQTMSKKDHSHTPWLLILYKYLQEWKEKHDGKIPSCYQEKNQLKEIIRKGVWLSEEGVPQEEENFEEAIKNVNSALVPTKIPAEVQALFTDDCCLNLHHESKPFWIMCHALKDFVENEGEGCLPVRGTIPDMTSDSDRYIKLQTVYREQAAADVELVTRRVHTLLQELGRMATSVTNSEIKTFCRNASFLRVVRCRSLAEEYNNSTARTEELGQHLESEEGDDVLFYILLRAVDRFYEKYSRFPGVDNDNVEPDIPLLKTCLSKQLQDWGLAGTVKDDYVHEMCRYGASELHTIAAYMGGVVAQEAIKILTAQFVPINNTYIYNGFQQMSTTICL
ncbi:NEDD8-activating enzyme E1 regulatory subunit-like isoform X2 [Pomacea canaliculata]|uniref:NEDD8-activating enzyme E1 regulatory subunit-like isoform X2 n=1 Tax=Pomacea canaliculata TaxID=400727 RepID=UPI000D727CB2|nr:NEDD8-activating enzyme E1 regulatory subunit-like isoform X2 [Pomacea canaliculata]